MSQNHLNSAMAVDDASCVRSRKRKRMSTKRKLLLNERVEVRSMELGFLGSWHSGTVIHCQRQKRHVRYDYILEDDGSSYVVEVVTVSAVLDGVNVSFSDCNERGFIRPIPPTVEIGEWDLPFGLCVDVNYQEAWWEGVVFDQCNGMEERSIFFPDLGDEMKIGIHQLRITQDWDEVTENWKPRGKWVFLELIEECERVSFVAVSIKQIYYDVRARDYFDSIRDWTCNVKDLWRDPVMEVVSDYYTLTLTEVFPALNLPRNFLEETLMLESVEPTANVDLNLEVDEANIAIVGNSGNQLSSNTDIHCDAGPSNAFGSEIGTSDRPMDKGDSSNLLDTDQNCGSIIPIQEKCDTCPSMGMELGVDLHRTFPENEVVLREEHVSPVQEVLPKSPKEISGTSCYEKNREHRHSTRQRNVRWQPLEMPEVQYCPDVINQYVLGCESKIIRELLKADVRKHIASLGWTIESTDGKYYEGRQRYRYKSPAAVTQDQKVFNSLLKVCKYLQKESSTNSLQPQNDQSRMLPAIDSNISNLLPDQPQKSQDLDVYPLMVAPSPSVKDLVEPELCPEAVVKYYFHALENRLADKRKWRLKAMKHLLAEGWILDYPTETRRRTLYTSPQNHSLGTLQSACRLYLQESIPKWTVSGMRTLNVSATTEEGVDDVDSDGLLECMSHLLQTEPELNTIDALPTRRLTENRSHKRMRNSKATPPKGQRNRSPMRVLRLQPSKKVQKVVASSQSHPKPQNVISWLIDRNMVLTRAKVYYRANRGREPPVAEGRITRDGIKCSCCQKVYGLGGFANHASGSSSDCTPSANIFLKDGRSLLDCQVKVMHDRRKRETIEKPSTDLCEDDNTCSVCHDGGELILCDHCPSAFHKECLDLEDIPDGDWFCPSCRCTICREVKNEMTKDGRFLTCSQCERKYHVGCLRNRATDRSRRYLHLEHWLCGKECEQIYAGLRKLLGKPVSLGADNLTWTLVKCVNSQSSDVCNTEKDFLAESYSKLSVALSVMHECFEPLHSPSSSRDLTEDVIFSRSSKANRLNFQGFYTVLLERNEELISVATIRVYGEKVAEVPLIGTRFQYRRHGMCRILMNELEKTLMKLGVKRLVLPAVPGVLETWTNSFGFVKMTSSERRQFLDYAFLDFQGTVLCQKVLTRSPSPDSVLTSETQPKAPDVFSVKCRINFDKSSSASEEDQAGERERD